MKIRQKIILIVTASILVTAVPGIMLTYSYVQRHILDNESIDLERSTIHLAKTVEERFSQSQPKLASLAHILEKELVKPIQSSEIEAFHHIMERNADDVWRNNKAAFNGNNEAGIFLPTNERLSDKQKVRHLRIKQVMDVFGSAASEPLENVWYLSLDRSEIIFDRTFPDFVFQQKADNDYTKTPWVTYTSPELNPQRELKFTPPLFDPVPKVWMVSALYPLYIDGHWIGSLGEDMQLTGVLESMFSNSQRFSGTQHLLLDTQGNYVLAGPWQKQLESSTEAYHPDLTNTPKLAALLKSKLSHSPRVLSNDVMMQGKRYLVIGVKLNPLGWNYFRLVPVGEVMASSQLLLSTLGVIVLLATLLTGGLINFAMRSSVTSRIKYLSDAMKEYVANHSLRISGSIGGNDEITEAGHAFDELAKDIDLGIINLKKAERELKATEELWRLALEGAGDGVWDWNVAENKVAFSKRWKEILGFAEDELENNFEVFESRLHPEDHERVLTEVQEYFERNVPTYSIEFRMVCKDGSYKWILARGIAAERDDKGKPLRMVGTHTDISERKKIEQQLKISATAFESQEGMIITDANNIILKVNHAFSRITGYSAEEVIGQTTKLLSSGKQDRAFYERMWNDINQSGAWEGEIFNRRKNGDIYPEHLIITAVKDVNDVVTNYVATLMDITLSKAASMEIENLAFYDPLTQLPNRRLLMDRIRQALAASTRSGQRGALLFLDLDHFKALNDTLGHDIGDLLLKQVAERLVSCVREGDTVARLGGDEFVVLLEDLSEDALEAAKQTETIAEKIIATLNQPYVLGTHNHHSSPSVGATLFYNHDVEMDILLKQADIAMYQAKDSGRNTLRFFDPRMQEVISSRANLEHELRKAIEQQQFELYYQIQVDNTDNAIGAEALIRWQHPERGMISPYDFITLAEETGLIIPIGRWVLESACAQLKSWQQNPLARDLTLSINVSAKQFFQVNFVELVQATLLQHEVDPKHLKIELTESMLIENIHDIIIKMDMLSKVGISFSLDDFGTGYSSLQYLKKLPLNQLKIDQSFVRDIVTDASDRAIVRTIITMARGLNLDVIAEGVELDSQLAYLGNYGCNNYQGYLFSKPVPIDEFEALLSKS